MPRTYDELTTFFNTTSSAAPSTGNTFTCAIGVPYTTMRINATVQNMYLDYLNFVRGLPIVKPEFPPPPPPSSPPAVDRGVRLRKLYKRGSK